MHYSITRNNQIFGPYNISIIQTYVYEGKILLQDKVVTSNGEDVSVRDILKKHKIQPKVKKDIAILVKFTPLD